MVKFDYYQVNGEQARELFSFAANNSGVEWANAKYTTSLSLKSIDKFYISNALYIYPTYKVKDSLSNEFIIRVAARLSFINEKWLIVNDKIQPRNINGVFTTYYLSQ